MLVFFCCSILLKLYYLVPPQKVNVIVYFLLVYGFGVTTTPQIAPIDFGEIRTEEVNLFGLVIYLSLSYSCNRFSTTTLSCLFIVLFDFRLSFLLFSVGGKGPIRSSTLTEGLRFFPVHYLKIVKYRGDTLSY